MHPIRDSRRPPLNPSEPLQTPVNVSKFFRLVVTSLLIAALGHAQDVAKPYRMFVGVDLLLKQEGDTDYLRIDALKPREALVADPEHPRVPLREAGPFSWDHVTKVSRAPVTISNFEQHKTFTLRNDKAMQYMSTKNNMVIYQQEKTDAARAAHSNAQFTQQIARAVYVYSERDAESRAGLEGGPAEGYTAGGGGGLNFDNPQGGIYTDQADSLMASNESVFEAQQAMEDQFFDENAIAGDTDFLDRMQGAAAEGGADVMELTFQLSSATRVADAYVVVMGSIKQDDEAGVVTFHQPVGAIGPEPRKIKIRKTGFKPGFTIEEVKLHLYTHGKELATNLSERAVDMTLQQAREFLLLSHIADHAVESVSPEPVWTLAPPALLAAKSGQQFDYPLVATIDADGSVLGIHESEADARAFLAELQDNAGLRTRNTPGAPTGSLVESVRVSADDTNNTLDHTGRLPAHVVAAMRDMVFLPALDIGTPVAGTASVNLAEFFR